MFWNSTNQNISTMFEISDTVWINSIQNIKKSHMFWNYSNQHVSTIVGISGTFWTDLVQNVKKSHMFWHSTNQNMSTMLEVSETFWTGFIARPTQKDTHQRFTPTTEICMHHRCTWQCMYDPESRHNVPDVAIGVSGQRRNAWMATTTACTNARTCRVHRVAMW